MSYQVLARKWRPSNFSEVAGQAHVLKTLINALDNQRPHHAYLFSGTRGVGKTTLARILAKCLNCDEGINSQPCGKCDACTEIDEGRFIDLIEVDAASRTKVEDTRELLENVQYSPARGRYKVYLIDEVHMLSNHSFNALLKTLEEPPAHVKFLFATTDPQKLPVTILSRCLQFNLKNLSPSIIVEHLQKILIEESVEYDKEALWQISSAASGSMRDALTLVDQGVSYCQGSIEIAGIVEMLGVPEQQQIFALLEAMSIRDVEELYRIINQISDQTPDYEIILNNLLSALHRLAIAQAVPGAVDNSFGDGEKIKELAAKFSAEDLQLYYQIGTKSRDELRLSIEMKSTFEMLLLRMLVFSPSFASERTELPVPEAQKKKNEPVMQPSETTNLISVEELLPIEVVTKNQVEGGNIKPDVISKTNGNPPEMNHEKWLDLYSELGINGIAANVLANTEFKSKEGQVFNFVLSEDQSAVYSEDIIPKLSLALSELLGEKVKVNIEIGQVKKETPAMLLKRLKQEARKEMIDEFEKDENVQEMIKHFSAKLSKESIAPIKE